MTNLSWGKTMINYDIKTEGSKLYITVQDNTLHTGFCLDTDQLTLSQLMLLYMFLDKQIAKQTAKLGLILKKH